jgi:UDP-N-acetylglucosamine 3-dehydrogenase
MTLRLGLVGRGRWGQTIERTLLSLPDVLVTVIAKGSAPAADLDGVLIVTQSASHAQTALPYVNAGIATFIEKPMATTVADAQRIQDAARQSGAPVFVGHIHLYSPAFCAMRDLLPALGDIQYLLCESANSQSRTESSVLWDWLPHDLSIARAILGRNPDSVAAWSISGGPEPMAAVSRFLFDGTPLVSTISWLSPARRRHVTIVGEKATLVFDDRAERRLALHDKDKGLSHPAYSEAMPLTLEMEAFLQMIRTRKGGASHIETGLDIVRAIAAAEFSIRLEGQPVAIP